MGKIIVANRKANKNFEEVKNFCNTLNKYLLVHQTQHTIMLAPPQVYLQRCNNFFQDINNIHIVSQTCSSYPLGAYTGEVHASMLTSLGIEWTIIGHSERREYFDENGEKIKLQIESALKAGLHIIYCCGEPEKSIEQGSFVRGQIYAELMPYLDQLQNKLIIAYEPCRAIGTGKVPTQNYIEKTLSSIKSLDLQLEGIPFLYGGSVKVANTPELSHYHHINGFLIGGASLDVEEFKKIISGV